MFKDFREQPSYPDPVAYKNIMYSGHLLQLISMYEELSGDMQFSTLGWSFVWNATTVIPYNTSKLVTAIATQMEANALGGVPCEPVSIFIICNNFPHNAFALYDLVHNTSFGSRYDASWQSTVQKQGLVGNPILGTGQYFKLVYITLLGGVWDSLASEGSDAWALGWMGPWWNAALDNNATTLVQGALHMARSRRWVNSSDECYLVPNSLGEKIFPFPRDISTSFWPMIEAQYPSFVAPSRAGCTVAWFENNYAQPLDLDGDGTWDAFRYNSSAGYANWVTANLVLSYALPPWDGGYLRDLFHPHVPTYVQRQLRPHLTNVSFPLVLVRSASFDESLHELQFILTRGDSIPLGTQTFSFVVEGLSASCSARIFLNAQIYNAKCQPAPACRVTAPLPGHDDADQNWLVQTSC